MSSDPTETNSHPYAIVKRLRSLKLPPTIQGHQSMKVYLGYIGIMEKKMETSMVCWGYIGMMEKKIKTARQFH